MADDTRKYDVAISFLHQDEPLALQLDADLSETLNVFVYSKKQETLAGTNGLETLREPFLAESRLVVVLFRRGWGETPWTRVEQVAITDRFLEDGWDFLLFVSLDDADAPPKWLPKSELRLSLQAYGPEQLLGAIKIRVEKLGGIPHIETAGDRAKRFQVASQVRADREERLRSHGGEAFQASYRQIVQELRGVVDETNRELTDFEVQFGFDGRDIVLRAKNVAMSVYSYSTYPITKSQVVAQEFDGQLALPGKTEFYMREAQVIGKENIFFDYQAAMGWCWHLLGSSKHLSHRDVAEGLVAKLLKLQERFDRREIRRDRFD